MKHTPLTALDVALADFLDSRMPSSDPRHRWLAALTSHQWGRGHACLDLEKLRHDPAALLAWDAASIARWPDHLTEAALSLPWRHGQASPLVLHGQRLYLQRAWHAEQSIRQHLQRRHQLPPSAPAQGTRHVTASVWHVPWRWKDAPWSSRVDPARAKPPR
jgi:exodeoxyribonuclease V alpha subunit